MEIKSTAFTNEQPIPQQFTCYGDNISPPLTITNVPASSQSLALWVHDPDAPKGDFTHWIVWNINPQTTHILQDQVPIDAVEGVTSFGTTGYGGPCPPSGMHRYIFELFALGATLNMPPNSLARDVYSALQTHTVTHATLMGTVSAR